MKDPNIEHGSSQKTASQMIDPVDDVYPTAFEGPGKLAIPRMRPYRTAVLPHFPVTTANLPAADFGYTKEQIRHAIRIIMSVSTLSTLSPPFPLSPPSTPLSTSYISHYRTARKITRIIMWMRRWMRC
jgi:hypothetical protein